MIKFISLATSPGKTGEFYYNHFFHYYGMDFEYRARKCLNLNLQMGDKEIYGYGGISVSMPYKHDIINFLNYIDQSVYSYGTCNTIKINDGELYGFNTDLAGVISTLKKIPQNKKVSILGDGAMGKLFSAVLREQNFEFNTYSRRIGNWANRHNCNSVVINTTALGTLTPQSPLESLSGVEIVIDLAISKNNLHQLCSEEKIKYIPGIEFYKQVFLEQFGIYTGIYPDSDHFDYLSNTSNKS